MSCSCVKNQNKDGVTISPYDYCPFCAEKHFSTALAEFEKDGNRQIIIGELELCKWHLFQSDLISDLNSFLDHRMVDVTSEQLTNFYNELNSVIEQEVADQNSGKQKKFSGRLGVVEVPSNSDMKLSERAFCSAWRMVEECGYISINRPLIIERLTAAQIYCYRLNYTMAEDLRDVRHLIQYRRESEIQQSKWLQLSQRFEDLLK